MAFISTCVTVNTKPSSLNTDATFGSIQLSHFEFFKICWSSSICSLLFTWKRSVERRDCSVFTLLSPLSNIQVTFNLLFFVGIVSVFVVPIYGRAQCVTQVLQTFLGPAVRSSVLWERTHISLLCATLFLDAMRASCNNFCIHKHLRSFLKILLGREIFPPSVCGPGRNWSTHYSPWEDRMKSCFYTSWF